MTDERPDSLAAQAASWVPPWERAAREPDRAYQAAAAEPDLSDDIDEPSALLDEPDDDTELDEANLSDDDDDFDEAFEGPNPPEYGEEEVPPELGALPGESGGPATVDAPRELPGEETPEPTDVPGGSELPLPAAVEDASEESADPGAPVDGPTPADGDDAAEVFDLAADADAPAEADERAPTEGGSTVGSGAAGDPSARGSSAGDSPVGGSTAGSSAVGGAGVGVPEATGGSAVDGDLAETAPAAAGGSAGRARRARPSSGIPAQGRGGAESGAAVGEPWSRTEEIDSEVSAMDDAELRAALEAILLVVDEPVAEMQLAQIMEQPTERVAGLLEDISARYTAAGHGFDLRRAAGGWRLYTRPEYAPYVERFVLDGQSVRLTQAALETLAVVAYKQPVTRSRISAIRGVNCDGVMRTLVTRGLIEECGTESETGAFLYRTTPLFLEKLGLNSVDQLPPLAPFLPDDVEEVLDASG